LPGRGDTRTGNKRGTTSTGFGVVEALSLALARGLRASTRGSGAQTVRRARSGTGRSQVDGSGLWRGARVLRVRSLALLVPAIRVCLEVVGRLRGECGSSAVETAFAADRRLTPASAQGGESQRGFSSRAVSRLEQPPERVARVTLAERLRRIGNREKRESDELGLSLVHGKPRHLRDLRCKHGYQLLVWWDGGPVPSR
jgi:hypothetical protein